LIAGTSWMSPFNVCLPKWAPEAVIAREKAAEEVQVVGSSGTVGLQSGQK
jgi:hypothetical protein